MNRVMIVRMLIELTLFSLHILNARILMARFYYMCVLSFSPVLGTFEMSGLN